MRASSAVDLGYALGNRFRIDACIGEGGMGRVFAVHDLETGRARVAKVLRRELTTDPRNLARFHQEATLAAKVRHPNVVNVFGLFVDTKLELPFIVMERIPGMTLDWLVTCDGALAERRAAAIFVQIAYALAAAHRLDVLHRDLKPTNVMITTDVDGSEYARVLDFGLAKVLEPGIGGLTAPGTFLGTPAYMAPEQITDDGVTAQTDLYLLGCTLHASLTGERPYDGEDIVEVMNQQVHAPIPELPRSFSPSMRALHRALLAKHPGDRPDSASTVAEMFDEIASGPSLKIPEGPTIADSRNPVRDALTSSAGFEDEQIETLKDYHFEGDKTEVGDLTPPRLEAL